MMKYLKTLQGLVKLLSTTLQPTQPFNVFLSQTQPTQASQKTMDTKIQFKIGMIGPTGSGKTSLISAICSEVQERLSNDPQMEFWPDGTLTQEAMKRAEAAFDTAINSPLFQVPELANTSVLSEYKFAVTLPAGQDIGFSILDYPGQTLGTAEFSHDVTPHLLESAALFVPISSDILMYWNDTKNLHDEFNAKCNMAANLMLDCNNVDKCIRNWIGEKKRIGAPAQLFFVPIKCEKYFDDNGGYSDNHQKLHEAVLERYVNSLGLTAKDKQLIQVNVYYVDTYGVVELRNIKAESRENGDLKLVPTFQRRNDQGKRRRTKNAYELLMNILKFQVENRFNLQRVETEKQADDYRESEEMAKQCRRDYEAAQEKLKAHNDSYTWWDTFWYTCISTDKKKKALEDNVWRTSTDRNVASNTAANIKNTYLLSKQQCETLEKAVRKLTSLLQTMENRQYTL